MGGGRERKKVETLEPLRENDQQQHHPDQSTTRISPAKHMLAIIALCFVMLTHGYLLISVFPYSGYMAIDLIPSLTEENAGSYAGLIASSFMAGRSFTSFQWGKWADTYGRKTVLFLSLGLSCFFTVCFGLATSFRWALFFRACLGLSNGLIGTAKTLVSELAGGIKKLETRGMGVVMGMWGWGFLFAPALSGALAEPVRQYPNSDWIQNDSALSRILTKYPFLLPNLVAAGFCLLSISTVSMFVHETLPDDQRRNPSMMLPDLFHWIASMLPKLCWGNWDESEGLPLIAKGSNPIVGYQATTGANQKARVAGEQLDNDHSSFEADLKECSLSHSESCSMLATTAKEIQATGNEHLDRSLCFRGNQSDTAKT